MGDIQDMSSLAKYMKQFTSDEFLEAMLDFHLLIYLASMDVYPLRVSICNSSFEIYLISDEFMVSLV